jgi:hypothetical protein
VPGPTAVITPPLLIVATALLLLVHVPNVVGLIDVVPPIHKLVFPPVIFVVGLESTVAITAVLDAVIQVPTEAST